MSGGRPSRSWRNRSVLVPLAISVAATAATIGLWLWLDDHESHSHHHGKSSKDSHAHESDSECESDAGGYAGSSVAEKRRYPAHGRIPAGVGVGVNAGGDIETCSIGGGGVLSGIGFGVVGPGGPALPSVEEESEPGSSVANRRMRTSYVGGGRESYHGGMGGGTVSMASPTSTMGSRQYVPPAKTRTVVIVVSAETNTSTLLASLPQPLHIPDDTTLHICIYTPSMAAAMAQSGSGSVYPPQPPPPSKVHDFAYSLLPIAYPKEYILPYTVHPAGTSSLLRHLAPEVVYIEEGLAGEDGTVMRELIEKGWIREGIVVLAPKVGEKGGLPDGSLAGLVDSSDEEEGKGKGVEGTRKWWLDPNWDGGRGGGSVLKPSFLSEDWERRVLRQ